MKKLRFLPLLLLVLLSLCATALAASIPGQQVITGITDANGTVTTLTDDDTATAWTQSTQGDVDLTIHMYRGTVGEIWIRNGYAYTQNWYNNYDRPGKVKVTVYYAVNQFTTSYDTYRYTLSDAYRPNTRSTGWNSGYQRLLLPKQYLGVEKIEITIEGVINGFSRTGATISDIVVAAGNHATATPRSYGTATPRPYVVYVTPTPGPTQVPTSVPAPTDEPIVYPITPIPDPTPTNTPLVYPVTPVPEPTEAPTAIPEPTATPTAVPEPVGYPSRGGVIGYSNQRIPTRSGPSTYYDEPGSFYSAGHEVKVISKSWDSENDLWWYQLEFKIDGEWYRLYTTGYRIDVDESAIPAEPPVGDPLDTRQALVQHDIYYGPGEEYARLNHYSLYEGTTCDIYAIEDDWAMVDYYNYAMDVKSRGWVPVNVLYPN
ncbi:MAG: hypothetical protein PUC00_02495 [Clostridiales bacterium]|nr:hypothetical protein [Clostridiales bacterium]